MPSMQTDVIAGETAATDVIATFDHLGAQAPKPVAAAIARRRQILAKLDRRTPAPGPDLIAAVIDAIDREIPDLSADPDVAAAVRRRAYANLPGIHGGIGDHLLVELRSTITEHTDPIVAAWRPAFDRAATELAEAHEMLGDADLDDAPVILRLGPDAVRAWGSVSTGLATVGRVLRGWRNLHGFTLGRTCSAPAALIIATPDAYLDDPQLYRADDPRLPWRLIAAGETLHLADLDAPQLALAATEQVAAERSAERANSRRAKGFAG